MRLRECTKFRTHVELRIWPRAAIDAGKKPEMSGAVVRTGADYETIERGSDFLEDRASPVLTVGMLRR